MGLGFRASGAWGCFIALRFRIEGFMGLGSRFRASGLRFRLRVQGSRL